MAIAGLWQVWPRGHVVPADVRSGLPVDFYRRRCAIIILMWRGPPRVTGKFCYQYACIAIDPSL
eukprot:10055535-Lingulodinium_polyedra.AAC.1